MKRGLSKNLKKKIVNNNNLYSSALDRGNEAYSKRNYSDARYWYNIALDGNYLQYVEASIGLFNICINVGNFKEARKILYKNKKDYKFVKYLGNLELYEGNFDSANEYYNFLPTTPDLELKKSIILVQKGDFELANHKFQELIQCKSKNVVILSIMWQINILILLKEYKKAYQLLSQLKMNKYTKHYVNKNLLFLNTILKSRLGIEDDSNLFFSHVNKDLGNIEIVKKHINERHIGFQSKECESYFPNIIDFDAFFQKIKKNINNINGYFDISRTIYKFIDPDIDGFVDGQKTHGISCITISDTKDIMNIYPFLPSDDFDKEGYKNDKNLTLKRKQNLKNYYTD